MQANQNTTSYEQATGAIPYNMTNDYMFRAVLQKNKTVLRGLVGALLHINPELIDVEITNPIELGQSYQNKEFMLDINVIVNGQTRLNLEMQVINYQNWKERSLSYLCRSFDNVFKGHDYIEVTPVIQISFLDFVLFPEAPEFYATYMMENVKSHMIYTDKIQLSVIQLCSIELATDEDCLYEIDRWASLFKAKTWKELKSVAASNQYMQSAVNTIYELSSDETIREQCRAREEFEAYQRYLSKQISDLKQQNAEQSALLADKDSQLADKDAKIADKDSQLAGKDSQLAAKDAKIAELLAINAELTAQLGKENV